jgi:hypothetical protein
MNTLNRAGRVAAAAVLVLLAGSPLAAQTAPSTAPPSPPALRWSVSLADGSTRSLAVVSLVPDGTGGQLTPADAPPVDLAEVLRLERETDQLIDRGANYSGLLLELRDGQRFPGEPASRPEQLGTPGESVVWVHPRLGVLRFALKDVLSVRRVGVGVPAGPTASATQSTEDTAVLLNGDIVRGVVSEVGIDGVVLLSATGDSQTVPWRSIRTLSLAAVGSAARQAQPSIRIELTDGTRLQSPRVELRDGFLLLTPAGSAGGGAGGQRLAVSEVAVIERVGFTAWPLTLLAATSVEHVPFLSVPGEPRFDLAASGGPLRQPSAETTPGRSGLRGLGLTARTRITYPVPDGFTTLAFTYQRDPRADRGSPVLRILGDGGAVLLEDADLGKPEARSARVDLKGAAQVTIEVDFGTSAGVQPWVNLIEPRLLRQ